MSTSDTTSNAAGTLGANAASIKDKVTDAAGQARDKAAELGTKTAEAIDSGLHTAAHKLKDTASSFRATGQTTGAHVTDAANRAADGLEAAGTYLHEHKSSDLLGGIEHLVRRNPGPSLVAAAAVGFLLGSALRSNDK